MMLKRFARGTADDGIAMPMALGLGLVMLMLVATAMTVVTGGLRKTNTDEDWNAALAAAYAGVEEYQSRLANDSTYSKYGNPSAPFTSSTGSTVTLPVSPNVNPAFGIGTSGSWASVPAPSGVPVQASYRYEIDNSDYQDKGILHLRSTGRVGDVTRSIVADLKQDGFIDYLWFTDYEVSDPAYKGVTTVDSNNKNVCERYAYGSPARSDSTCGTIQFGDNDEFGGPVRSNDRMLICESTFHGAVVSSSTTSPIYSKPSGCGNPTFDVGTGPVYAGRIDMPPTNTELKKETRNDLPSDVPRPGCLYTGPTVITFETVSGVPKMRVLSPWTKKTNIAATVSGATNPTQCGTPGTGTNGLGSPTGALLNVLSLNLIYVQAVPAVGSSDANAPSGTGTPTNVTCTSSGGWWSDTPPGWYYKSGSTYVARFPLSNEITPTGASSLVHYGCRAGDLYVKGTLGGQLTLAAENYVYVTGDLTYIDKQTDMLGLVGTNAVYVWNPVSSSSGSSLLTGATNREIDAAILSVAHTFQVQNYNRGARGTLTVFGAIAQKFRGSVGTSGSGGTGYDKDYQYDSRFKNTAPPKFLTPASTTYGVTQYATVPAAFNADGSTP
jgi:hypothetical protein